MMITTGPNRTRGFRIRQIRIVPKKPMQLTYKIEDLGLITIRQIVVCILIKRKDSNK